MEILLFLVIVLEIVVNRELRILEMVVWFWLVVEVMFVMSLVLVMDLLVMLFFSDEGLLYCCGYWSGCFWFVDCFECINYYLYFCVILWVLGNYWVCCVIFVIFVIDLCLFEVCFRYLGGVFVYFFDLGDYVRIGVFVIYLFDLV